jgi:hypothetical protein
LTLPFIERAYRTNGFRSKNHFTPQTGQVEWLCPNEGLATVQ